MATTQIRGAQVANTVLDTRHLTATANIADGQLANGAVFLKRDGTVALTANLSANGATIVGLANPSSANDAATKAYVDAARQGLDAKDSVRVATTANITLSGTQTIDTIALSVNDRVLVKNQSNAALNGIYTVQSGAWTRAADANASALVTAGMYCWVTDGGTQGDTAWVLTTNDPITLDTTALAFTQYSGAGAVTAGDGLSSSGNIFSVKGNDGITVASTGVFANIDTNAGLKFDASSPKKIQVNLSSFLEFSSGAIRLATTAAGNGLTGGAASALAVKANTGIVANATGVFVDSATAVANNASHAFGKDESQLNANSALTANAATYLNGKTEANLNVNSALTANATTYVNSKTEGNLNVNNATTAGTANNSTYAYGKTEGALSVNNAANFGGNLPAYYTNATNISAGTLAGARMFVANATVNGAMSTAAQTFAGDKTFSANLIAGANTLFVDSALARVGINCAPGAYALDVKGNLNYTGTFYHNGIAVDFGGSNTAQAFQKLDSIASQFNGAQTVFTLLANGGDVNVSAEEQLLIAIGGVMQEPNSAFTVANTNIITFSAAPPTGATFWGVYMGAPVDIGTITPGVDIVPHDVTASGTISGNGSGITGVLNANNAAYAYGKTEGALNANSALTANSATYLGSKAEGALNVNSASSAVNANNSTYLNGQASSYYLNTSSAGNGLGITTQTLWVKANTGIVSNATGVFVKVADFDGAGLEDDGSNNLRIAAAAAGNGLAGGAGSALSVKGNTGITVNSAGVFLATQGVANTHLGAIAGNGLTGGSGSGLAVLANTGIVANATGVFLGTVANTNLGAIAGNGLTGGSGVALAVLGNTGITVNATGVWLTTQGVANTHLGAIAGNGLAGGAGSGLSVKANSGIVANATGIFLDTPNVVGTGIESDGATPAKIRIAAQGNGLAGGAGSTLSVKANTGLTVNSSGLFLGTVANTNLGAIVGNGLAGSSGAAVKLDGSWFVANETPAGTANGVNVTFTLATTPYTGTVEVYLNGILQDPGAGNDYTISGGTITMLSAPIASDKLRARYLKNIA